MNNLMKMFYKNKIFNIDEIQCNLECLKIHDEYYFILKNIKGDKKIELFGSNVSEIDLNLLLAEKFRDKHKMFMIDILTKKNKSKYWDLFINGKMSRNIEIINPLNNKIFNVSLIIKSISNNNDLSIFNVIFTNILFSNKNFNNNNHLVLKHELNSLIKSNINLINELEKKYDINNVILIKDLLNEEYKILNDERKLICKNINLNDYTSSNQIKLYVFMPKLIRELKSFYNKLLIKINISTIKLVDVKIFNEFEEIIKQIINILIMMNCIFNCEICFDIIENNNLIEINTTITNISKITILEIVEAINFKFLNNNNQLNFTYLVDNLSIKIFLKICPINNNIDENVFSLNQINQLYIINKPIIVIIDDIFVNLKLLLASIIKHKQIDLKLFPKLTSGEWQNVGMFLIDTDEYKYILAANGIVGEEICIITNPHTIITDIQMPLLNGIDMIKILLNNNINSKIFITSAYEDSSDEEFIQFIKNNNLTFIEKGKKYDWIKEIYCTLD